MERMPSASEMERYKQEMMSMYRRANPNARPASQPSVAAQPASPPVQTANEMNRAAQTLTSSNSTAPSDSRNSSVVEPLIEPGAVPQAGPSEAENNSSTGTTPSETPPRSSESVSHGRDLSDAANRPRFPEDFPQEPHSRRTRVCAVPAISRPSRERGNRPLPTRMLCSARRRWHSRPVGHRGRLWKAKNAPNVI